VLAVEMEAAAVFTLCAMRGVRAGCLLTVSDTIGEEIVRISDEDLRSAVDNMMALALETLNALN
jgi:purine-nucleoside phosphorylase